MFVILNHLRDETDRQLRNVAVLSLRSQTEFLESSITPLVRENVKAFEGLTFEETFLANGLAKQCIDEGSHNGVVDILKFLVLDDFSDESESFFGVVASEVVDLCYYLFIVEGQKLVDEEGGVVTVSLSQVGCIEVEVLKVWNWMYH